MGIYVSDNRTVALPAENKKQYNNRNRVYYIFDPIFVFSATPVIMDVEKTEDQVCHTANVDIQPDFDAIGIEMLLPVLHVLFNNMRGYVVARAVDEFKHNYQRFISWFHNIVLPTIKKW